MPKRGTGPKLARVKWKGNATEYWIIRWYEAGAKRQKSTGIPVGGETNDGDPERDPQAALAAFIQAMAPKVEGPARADEITIDTILHFYGTEHAVGVAAPDRIAYAGDALLTFWAGKPLSFVRGETCRAYLRHRKNQGVAESTVRRELGTLQAAINHCHGEGYIIEAPAVWKPPKGDPKEQWLKRSEAAALLRAARLSPARSYLCLFILIGLYTGSRKNTILKLQWEPNEEGGWIDLNRRLMYRAPVGKKKTVKRQPPCPIPNRLFPFLVYARRRTETHVIETDRDTRHTGRDVPRADRSVGDVKKGFEAAAIRAGLTEQKKDKSGKPLYHKDGSPQIKARITPHILRHTAATWYMQAGIEMWEAGGFLGMSVETLQRVYGHHHPSFMSSLVDVDLKSGTKRALER